MWKKFRIIHMESIWNFWLILKLRQINWLSKQKVDLLYISKCKNKNNKKLKPIEIKSKILN